jgi:hypothetical protein
MEKKENGDARDEEVHQSESEGLGRDVDDWYCKSDDWKGFSHADPRFVHRISRN